MRRTHLDLFSGIGGFALAAKWNGIETVQFVEIDRQCQKVLRDNFPGVPIHEDIRSFVPTTKRAYLVAGGDPCPCRSKARSTYGSTHPDMSGYFLAVVAGCRPRWVVRENVPASDDAHFVAALEAIGYRSVVISTNSITFTAQNRRRDFIVAADEPHRIRQLCKLPVFSRNIRYFVPISAKEPSCFCLTTHRQRYDPRDNYIWERGRLRILDSEERRRLSGYPDGWITGLSKTVVARMYGNTIVPQVAAEIIKAIIEADRGADK